ncbi:hypothetical protein PPTG_07932 [Phytophthora nicotianae INRA-310]|uniref:Myb-like domain-containing protein n=1 Tax=Phytophthora nicotianae (strain INRA-310) TaxID=761204 RepID=W2QP86_PHYN3|nr:hypothetical protein PPTG_07932 [Phytophthora nicotianae INRA-310]ETN14304.1 hypothetical protein PPTG_07932 [Phytophthora nicotianae INRA-310]
MWEEVRYISSLRTVTTSNNQKRVAREPKKVAWLTKLPASKKTPPSQRKSPAGATDTQSKRKKAFRFVPSSDILLLKEAVKHRPWAAGHGETQVSWSSVAIGLKTALPSCTADGKACRRRFNALLDVFRRDELESLRASGTAEDFEEREQLLTDCMALVDECLQAKADKTEKEKKEAERRDRASADVVQSAMEGIRRSRSKSPEDDVSTPSSSKKKKRSSTEALVEFLDAKAETRSTREKQKERQLHLEERRLALEEQRLQQDREKTDKLMEMMASQMGLMSKLIEKINK